MSRFDYIRYDAQTAKLQARFKKQFQELELLGTETLETSRWTSLFLTHLEFAYMAVGKELRDAQILRNGPGNTQEERNDG